MCRPVQVPGGEARQPQVRVLVGAQIGFAARRAHVESGVLGEQGVYGVGNRFTVQSETGYGTDDEIAEAARTAGEASESRSKPRSIDQREELHKTA